MIVDRAIAFGGRAVVVVDRHISGLWSWIVDRDCDWSGLEH